MRHENVTSVSLSQTDVERIVKMYLDQRYGREHEMVWSEGLDSEPVETEMIRGEHSTDLDELNEAGLQKIVFGEEKAIQQMVTRLKDSVGEGDAVREEILRRRALLAVNKWRREHGLESLTDAELKYTMFDD